MKRQVAKGLDDVNARRWIGAGVRGCGEWSIGRARLTAQIPFDFIVADQTLRSGQYQ